LLGAALLYGDGVITPAISVLSAMEGLKSVARGFDPLIVPLTILVLIALFRFQRRGTAGVSAIFGPAMLIWFVVIGLLGARKLLTESPDHTSALWAVDPRLALGYFARHGWDAIATLGAVVLVVTGSEALYADMGHFGPVPIRVAWYAVVLPALVLNYFGQGALVLERGTVGAHPFYDLAPDWLLLPLIMVATVATVIASQALISGAFSLTQQAAQLDLLPRLRVVHTSDVERGQIYMPGVNAVLMVVCVALVLAFRSSSALAAAYGIAVTGTMTATTFLFFAVARRCWGWPWPLAALPVGVFLAVDLSFLAGNLDKLDTGGWVPITIALVVYVMMSTWKRGRALLLQVQAAWSTPTEEFLAAIERGPPSRVPGTAVYLTGVTEAIPPVLLRNLLANQVLHERVILLSAVSVERPRVRAEQRARIEDLGHGLHRAVVSFGFMEAPTIDALIRACRAEGLAIDIETSFFFFSRHTPLPTGKGRMARWRKLLFAFLSQNAPSITRSFAIPPARVVEVGAQIEI
jgi:KUP system potassium uptake protein